MPAYSATLDTPLLDVGFSQEAVRVAEIESLLAASPRLDDLVNDILDLWDSSSLRQDDTVRKTANAAISFALQLPRSFPVPEVSLDPDGEVSFDWTGRDGQRFSVSVNAANRLAFAGRFSATSKLHGVEQLLEVFPQEITRGIRRTFEYRR